MPTGLVVVHADEDLRRQSSADGLCRGNMIRNRKFRMMGMATVSAVGLASVLVLGSASIAAAATGTSVTLSPNFVSATAAATGADVTVTWHKLGHMNANELVIVECNYNVYTGDAAACNEDPSNLDLPGGPWIPTTQTAGNGSAVIQVTSGTVGDGTCDGGQVCAIVIANLSTETPIAGPIPFGLTP